VLAAAAMDGEQRFYECIGLIWQKLNMAYKERCLILGFAVFQGGSLFQGNDVFSKEHDLRTLKIHQIRNLPYNIASKLFKTQSSSW
jgi:hypothetical protein